MKAEFQGIIVSCEKQMIEGTEWVTYALLKDGELIGDGKGRNIESSLDQAHKHLLAIMQ